jgi:hypothetical protein
MTHDSQCRCAGCRHARFNPGPPTRARGYYGNLRVGAARRRRRINQVHEQALRENAIRDLKAVA